MQKYPSAFGTQEEDIKGKEPEQLSLTPGLEETRSSLNEQSEIPLAMQAELFELGYQQALRKERREFLNTLHPRVAGYLAGINERLKDIERLFLGSGGQ